MKAFPKIGYLLALLLCAFGEQENPKEFSPITGNSFEAFEMQWQVKRKSERHGPGPNLFGQRADNLMIDPKDGLLFQIKKARKGWSCAEIISENTVGYGDYWVEIEADISKLNKQVVFGFFTYDHQNPPTHSEVDVEVSRWGKSKADPAQFAFYVALDSPVVKRFATASGSKNHVFVIKRRADYTEYYYYEGTMSDYNPSSEAQQYFKYSYPMDSYKPTQEKLHLNLWLFQGKWPAFSFLARDRKILVKNVKYTPFYQE